MYSKNLIGLLVSSMLLLSVSACKQKNDGDDLIPYNREMAKKHIRPLAYAASLTSQFKKGKIELARQLKDSGYLDKRFNLPTAEYFNRDAIAALLNQKEAKGIRIYMGKDRDTIKLVLVGVDEAGNDITGELQAKNPDMKLMSSRSSSSAVIVEAGQRCPTMCPVGSPLDK